MKKDEIYQIVIEDMSHSGEGIGKVQGFPLFVKDAIIGDEVEVKVIKAKKNYGYARLMNICKPSPKRTEAPCGQHRRCGGCQIQAMDYKEQLRFKENMVKNNLQRIGGFADVQLEPILGMEHPFRYRNKAQYPIGKDKDGRVIAGFYAGRTHQIMECEDCLLGEEQNAEILRMVIAYMRECNIEPYNEETATGLVRHVLIRKGYHTGEWMVCLVINGQTLPYADLLIDKLQQIEGMTSVSISVNTGRDNVIMGNTYETLWGKAYITDYIKDIRYRISPLSFFQVNPIQTRRLYEKALEYAALTGEETVWDLYCGTGSISLFLAQQAKQVYGVEIIPQAIEDAKANAKDNQMNNLEFFVGKAEEVFVEACRESKDRYAADVVVVDPPRKGCQEELLRAVLDMEPQRVVYVSCDPATLARDLKILCEEKYEIVKVQPVDMFPHTVHVETVCLLSKLHEAKQSQCPEDKEKAIKDALEHFGMV